VDPDGDEVPLAMVEFLFPINVDILGQEFKARPDGTSPGQIEALSFTVSGLLAAAKDKALRSVRMVAVVQGQAVG
jgi:hypothetical protein